MGNYCCNPDPDSMIERTPRGNESQPSIKGNKNTQANYHSELKITQEKRSSKKNAISIDLTSSIIKDYKSEIVTPINHPPAPVSQVSSPSKPKPYIPLIKNFELISSKNCFGDLGLGSNKAPKSEDDEDFNEIDFGLDDNSDIDRFGCSVLIKDENSIQKIKKSNKNLTKSEVEHIKVQNLSSKILEKLEQDNFIRSVNDVAKNEIASNDNVTILGSLQTNKNETFETVNFSSPPKPPSNLYQKNSMMSVNNVSNVDNINVNININLNINQANTVKVDEFDSHSDNSAIVLTTNINTNSNAKLDSQDPVKEKQKALKEKLDKLKNKKIPKNPDMNQYKTANALENRLKIPIPAERKINSSRFKELLDGLERHVLHLDIEAPREREEKLSIGMNYNTEIVDEYFTKLLDKPLKTVKTVAKKSKKTFRE